MATFWKELLIRLTVCVLVVNKVIFRFGFEGSVLVLLLQLLVIAYNFTSKFDDFDLKSALIFGYLNVNEQLSIITQTRLCNMQ